MTNEPAGPPHRPARRPPPASTGPARPRPAPRGTAPPAAQRIGTQETHRSRGNHPAILIDIGGVLVPDYLHVAAAAWSTRLGTSQQRFIAALFGGNDHQVLIGRTSEASWWNTVRDRLRISEDLIAEIRGDLASRETWDDALLAGLRRVRGSAKTAVVSNAWPHMRTSLAKAGLPDAVDAIVLSCEVGFAKPDPRIYAVALRRLGADPADALFIDDTPGHVATARSLGMTGHVHTTTEDTLARIDAFRRSPN